jgi:uncharacterized membrane protein
MLRRVFFFHIWRTAMIVMLIASGIAKGDFVKVISFRQ